MGFQVLNTSVISNVRYVGTVLIVKCIAVGMPFYVDIMGLGVSL